MKHLRIFLLLALAMGCLSTRANSAVDSSERIKLEAQNRATQEKADLFLHEIEKMKTRAPSDSCNPQYKCVPHCTYRLSNGTCDGYGSDFCGPDAACATDCTYRLSDGTCNDYGNDFCGPNASCTQNCTYRMSDGSCNSYGSDICF